MSTNPHHLDPEEDALVKMGYELEDVDYKKLGKSMYWFFGFVIFCGVAGLGIFIAFIGLDKWRNPAGDTAPFVKRMPAAPNPLLQTNTTARTDISALRQEEIKLLHGAPTWLDESKGVVRIPIEQAMNKFVAEAGGDAHGKTTMTSGAPPAFAPAHHEGAGEGHGEGSGQGH